MAFFGLFGDKKPPKVKPSETVGSSGTAVYGGYISTHEKLGSLTGTERFKTYSDAMLNVDVIGAGVRLLCGLVSGTGWQVQPSKDDVGGEYAAKLDTIIHGMRTPWHRVTRKAAMFRFLGFSVQEWTAIRLPDGSIGLLDIEARPQHTIEQWDVDEYGHLVGVVQRNPTTQADQYLPRSKIVYMLDDTLTDSPDGIGLLRHCMTLVKALQKYEQIEGQGYETDLRGVPLIRAPIGALDKMVQDSRITVAERNAILAPGRSFAESHIKGSSTGLFMDSTPYSSVGESSAPSSMRQWDVELLNGGGSSHEAIGKAIDGRLLRIARILGVEGMMVGGSDSGSLALAKSKEDKISREVDSINREIADTFDHDIVDTMWKLNGWPVEMKPMLVPDPVNPRDVSEVVQSLSELARAGSPMMPDDPAVNVIRSRLGLPDVSVESFATDAILPDGDESVDVDVEV